MKIRTLFSALGPKSLCVAALLLLSACGKQQEVKRADEAYQRALALNDLGAQRNALLALTKADEDVSDYWMRLAGVEIQLGAYSDAYLHFTRAHELDRTAVYPLSMMIELAVINGRLDLADDHLKALTVLAPGDRAVAVARAYTALREANYERAQENVDLLLAQNPGDSTASVLQTRILITQKRIPEAVERLNRQFALNANDRAMLRSLGAIHRYVGDWRKAAAIDLKLWRLNPSDYAVARLVVTDALRARDFSLASNVTERVLVTAKTRDNVDNVLSAWAELAPTSNALSTDHPNIPDQAKIALAHYFNRVGRLDRALASLGGKARSLDSRANVAFNAVLAESLFLTGQIQPARKILDRILRDEPDNPVALSARARLLSGAGDHRMAIIDAQRLVASYAAIADYRFLLVSIYRVSRDGREAERALWDGYRDFPANETIYNEVRRTLIARGDSEGSSRLDAAYQEARFSRLLKDLA